MGKINIIISDEVENKFRKEHIRKRGDLSRKIEELMKDSVSKGKGK